MLAAEVAAFQEPVRTDRCFLEDAFLRNLGLCMQGGGGEQETGGDEVGVLAA